MTIFFAAINLLVLGFIGYRVWKKDESILKKKFFWPACLLKVVSGISLGLLYTYYYDSGDTFLYFREGVVLADFARNDFSEYIAFLWSSDASREISNVLGNGQPRALFMIKMVSVANIFSHDNYWITGIYFSFISFLSAWILVKEIVRTYPMLRTAVVVGFLFFPSIVFWSSGLIKESLAMASMYFLAYAFFRRWMKKPLTPWVWAFLPVATWLLWNLKYYYLAVFMPVVFACLLLDLIFADRLRQRSFGLTLFSWAAAFLVPLAFVSLIHPNFHPQIFLEIVHSSYLEYHAISSAEDLIFYNSFQPTVLSVIQHAPWALFSGLFRKMPWEAASVFQLASACENVVLLVFTVAALRNVPRLIQSPHRILFLAMVSYCILLCLFLALSTPNFGTLSRYRVGFLPFYFLLISIDNPIFTWIESKTQRSSNHLVP